MKVIVMVKATKNSEAGVMPSEKLLAEMGQFNEQLVKAGVMVAGEGLLPSSKGKRVRFADGKKTVLDGPFAETKELVAGFWIWQVRCGIHARAACPRRAIARRDRAQASAVTQWGRRLPARPSVTRHDDGATSRQGHGAR